MSSEELAVRIGRAIKFKRLINDLTRPGLAEASGVKPLTIQRMENGQGSALGLDNLLPILDTLKLDISDFLQEIRKEMSEKSTKNIDVSEKEWESAICASIQSMPIEQKMWLKKFIANMAETNLEKT